MEGMENSIPLDYRKNKEISDKITEMRSTIQSLRAWLIGGVIENGKIKDAGRKKIMNEEGANYFCSWCEEHTATPVFFTKRDYNDAVRMILDLDAALRQTIAEKFEDWDMDFNYAEDLVMIFDSLASAALYGSVDGFTLQKVTEHLMITEMRGDKEQKKGGLHLPNIFKRGGNEGE